MMKLILQSCRDCSNQSNKEKKRATGSVMPVTPFFIVYIPDTRQLQNKKVAQQPLRDL